MSLRCCVAHPARGFADLQILLQQWG